MAVFLKSTAQGSETRRNPKRSSGTAKKRGSIVVEFALAAPVLVLLFLGAADFARVFHAALIVSDAAHAGALYGAQSTTTAADTTGISNAATSAAQELPGMVVSSSESCKCPDGTTTVCSTGVCTGTKQVYVNVTAHYGFQTLFPYPGIPHTIGLGRTAVLRAQ